MAGGFQRMLDVIRLTSRLSMVARHSSVSTRNQRTCCLPVQWLENKPVEVSSLSRRVTAQDFDGPLFHRVASLSINERIAPPVMPKDQMQIFDLPTTPSNPISLDMPTMKSLLDKVQISPDCVKIEAPQREPIVEKKAHRMIVIRRRKMKKHQRKKFRKKYHVMLTQKNLRVNSANEERFLTEIATKLVGADAFDAKEYVAAKLKSAYEPLPVKPKLVKPLPWEFQPIFHSSKKKD